MARGKQTPKTTEPVVTKTPEELLLEKAIALSTLTEEAFAALSTEEQAPHLEAAKTALEEEAKQAEDAKQDNKDQKVKLVKMTRDAEQYPDGPYEADVHPDEVENYKAGGFVTE